MDDNDKINAATKDENYYKELIKKTMKAWSFYGVASSFLWYPLLRSLFSEKDIELSMRFILGGLIAYDMVKNKNRVCIIDGGNYRSRSKLVAIQFFCLGAYFVIGAIHIYYVWR